MIVFECPVCHLRYDNPEGVKYGQKVECAVCKSVFFTTPIGWLPVVVRSGTLEPPMTNTSNSVQPPASSNPNKIVISFDDIPSSNSSPVERKLSPRQRRLLADSQMMQQRFTTFPYIKLIEANGNPPERYVVEYYVRGIDHLENGQIIFRNNHRVEIKLPGTYPRTQPICRMLTPIFHPNIEPAVICIGDHWTAGERLCDLVVRIGEMIAYQSYNIKSPLDGEAAMWADLNNELLPVDKTDLMPPEE